MEQSQRANAAQMAARNIKQAKPKSGRRPGANSMGRSDQAPQFAPNPAQGGGGMFGGSVQGGGSFNFAPPAGVPSFPPTTFGSQSQSFGTPSPEVSDSEGRPEGDNRAAKRQFGGSSTMPPSNSFPPFGQNQSIFAPANPPQAPGGNIFSFGASQSQPSTGINFNASAPSNAPFSFGASTQSPSPSPSISFGSGPIENKPANNPFNFGSQQNQSPGIAFGQTPAPQDKPAAAAPFQFGQTSTTTSSIFNSTPAVATPSTGINFGAGPSTTSASTGGFNFLSSAPAPATNFGSMATTQPPSNNFFGTASPAEPPKTTNLFGSITQTPTSSLFSGLNAPTPSNNMFGKPKESPAPTSNLFGGLGGQNQQSTTSNMFSSNSQPSSTPSLFAEKTTGTPQSNMFSQSLGSTEKKVETPQSNFFGQAKATPVTSNIFGEKKSEGATSNIFGNSTSSPMFNSQPAAPIGNLFGSLNKGSTSASDLFGNLNKPVESSVTEPKVNGTLEPQEKSPVKSNPFQSIPPPTPVMQPKPLFSTPAPSQTAPLAGTNGTTKPTFSFGSAQSSVAPSSPKSTSFSPLKPVDAPSIANQPPPNGMFPSLSPPTTGLQRTADPTGLPSNILLSTIENLSEAISALSVSARSISDSELREKIPGNFSAEDLKKIFATYRITMMNRAMQGAMAQIGTSDPTVIFNFYMKERELILKHYAVVFNDLKQKPDGHNDNNPGNRSQNEKPPSVPEPIFDSSNKRKAMDDEVDQSPNKRNRQIESSGSFSNEVAQTPVPPPVATQTTSFSPFGTNGNIAKPPALPAPSIASPAKSKRKAEDELTQNTEQLSPLRREMKTPKLGGSSNSPRSGSQTSNIFKSILESPPEPGPAKTSPQKRATSPEKPTEEAPRFNPFGSLQVPKSPSKALAPPSPAATNMFSSPVAPATSNMFSVKHAAAVTKVDGTVQPSEPLGMPKFVPPSGNLSSDAAKAQAFKMPTFGAPTENKNKETAKSQPFKMPTFGSPSSGATNFLAQFGAQAKKNEVDEEAKKYQAAKDADFDSEDDDEEEFKANWQKKRAEELKELERIAKSGQGFKFGDSKPKTPEPSSTPKKSIFEHGAKPADSTTPKPIFDFGTSTQTSSSNMFSSVNGSRTSTPGLLGSSTGSVLDGHTGKVASFGNNIFGHLSDADSGKGEPENDSPDEDSDTGVTATNGSVQKSKGKSSSETALDKSVAGASTKKQNPFGLSSTFGTSSATGSPGSSLFGKASKESSKDGDESSSEDKESGGTRTPGGSLFDRITKDSSGNPVRHISTEEKENTQPSTRNIFGDMKTPSSGLFGKSSGPADQTWKPDSPIKFGTTSSGTSAPTIDITSATPTKSASPSNFFGGLSTTPSAPPPSLGLFGAKTDAKPFSSLFGTSTTSKAAPAPVGFGFGAPSAPTSLFPSAAVSATTSRASTPGATTDGESGADADPDAERHEQIDLTAVGPGEEHEDIVHEVRSKALKFVANKDGGTSSWETRGVGPLRILKHRDTNATRILLRADPSGTIVLNKSILGELNYAATGKTVKLTTHGDEGKSMETWILQVKTSEMAEELASKLEANKAT